MVYNWLLSLWSRISGYVLVAAAAFAFILKVKYDGKKEGRLEEREKLRKETDKIKGKWDEIDNRSSTVDADLEWLRKRSDKH